jgi:hypothetical protein
MIDHFASQSGLARVQSFRSSNTSLHWTAGQANTSNELRQGRVQLLVLLIMICWLTGCV